MKIFYHNITKAWYNKSDLCDAIENSDFCDRIKFSISGNALMFDIYKEDTSIESKGEYSWIRKQFKDKLTEYIQTSL